MTAVVLLFSGIVDMGPRRASDLLVSWQDLEDIYIYACMTIWDGMAIEMNEKVPAYFGLLFPTAGSFLPIERRRMLLTALDFFFLPFLSCMRISR